MKTSLLGAFPRVLWIGDVEQRAVLSAFVFERLRKIQSMPWGQRCEMISASNLDRATPVTWTGTRANFERLEVEPRRETQSFRRADVAMLALMEGDALGAIEATIAQLGL